jgi:hypothetical protein
MDLGVLTQVNTFWHELGFNEQAQPGDMQVHGQEFAEGYADLDRLPCQLLCSIALPTPCCCCRYCPAKTSHQGPSLQRKPHKLVLAFHCKTDK